MGAHRERLKILLFQLRENEEIKKIDRESYLRATGLDPEQLVIFDVFGRAPDASLLSGLDAIIVGGSRWSVWEDAPNLPALVDLLAAAKKKKIPMLGICFGAQLFAHAFGGQVERDEEHAEWGTFQIETTDDAWTDMLFADTPFFFPAMCAHHDKIAKLPPGAILLASSARCQIQAFVIPGADIYAFQFHPERSKSDYETLLAMKGRDCSVNQPGLDVVRASLKETKDAEALLAKFIERIVLQRR